MIDTERIVTEERIQELFRDYVAYVLISAKGLYREPHHYGPLRMYDAMEKGLRVIQN